MRVENGKIYKLARPPIELARRILEMKVVPETKGNSGTSEAGGPPNLGDDFSPQTIFYEPNDDRYHVTNHTTFPMRATGRWTGSGCTAAFIGPRTVFSAAHCFYDRPSGTWINSGNFAPGRNSIAPTEPWGQWAVVTFYIPTAFAQQGSYSSGTDYDYAVADLAIAPGWTGSPGWYGTTSSIYNFGSIAGYPQDKPGQVELWDALGPMTGSTGQKYKHKIDMVGGDSGAALRIVSTANNLAGVNIAEVSSYNLARKWDSTTYNFVRDYSTAW